MSFLDRLRNEFIDIIDWPDQGNSDVLVWKFPRYDNEIKMNAKLPYARRSRQYLSMKVL